jgi:hypothetical protein
VPLKMVCFGSSKQTLIGGIMAWQCVVLNMISTVINLDLHLPRLFTSTMMAGTGFGKAERAIAARCPTFITIRSTPECLS